ncbi:MAG TPA: hypothetical protein VL425_09415, partial [Rudaea sp.]|nr:hypothetical protein [Rudaea sp.]
LDTTYWASHDYLGDAFVYQFVDAQVQGLTTNLSTQGCGPLYDAATSFVQPYVIQQMQTQINNMINSYIPTGASDPGVGDTICPAP